MISVIIPVYNAEAYLDRCLASIYNQTFSDFEAIIVDDGSNDGSLKIAKGWSKKDGRFVIVSQENSGVSKARNTGIDAANGEWICFVDADDYVDRDYFLKLIQKAEYGIIPICNFVHNDNSSCVLSSPWDEYTIEFDNSFIREYLVFSLGKSIAFSPCNKMFSTRILKMNNIRFSEEISIGEDMIFVLKYLSYCRCMFYVNEGLYHYCIRDDSSMNNKSRDYLPAYNKTLQTLSDLEFTDGSKVDAETINLWCRESLLIVLTNSYLSDMSYKGFNKYYDKLVQSEIFINAGKCKSAKNIKRRILTKVIKQQNPLMLYLLVILNNKL